MVTHVCTEKETLERIERKLDELHGRMFVGNGTPSISVRIDRVEQVQKVALWVASALGGGGLAAGGTALFMYLFRGN